MRPRTLLALSLATLLLATGMAGRTAHAADPTVAQGPSKIEFRLVLPAGASGAKAVTGPDEEPMTLSSEILIGNADIARAEVRHDDSGGAPGVDLYFTPEAAKRLRAWSAEHVGSRIAILVDDQVKAAPVLRAEIGDRSVILFSSPEEAEALAASLGAGRAVRP